MLLKIGRFVLTITKFEYSKQGNTLQKETQTPTKRKALHIKRKSPKFTSEKTIYSFESFDAFCDFCNFLRKSKYKEQIFKIANTSDLYEYNSNYYLIFSKVDLDTNVIDFICPTITEFAHFVDNSELFERKIIEYGKPIIEKTAILTAMEYFV